MRGQGDEGSDGVETPSNKDGRAQGLARTEGARLGAGMGARRRMDDGAMMQRY